MKGAWLKFKLLHLSQRNKDVQISNLKAEKFLVTNSINRLFCVTFEKALYSATSIATNILNSLHSDVISCTSKCYIFIEVPMTVRNATFKDDVTQGCKMSPLQKRLRVTFELSARSHNLPVYSASIRVIGTTKTSWLKGTGRPYERERERGRGRKEGGGGKKVKSRGRGIIEFFDSRWVRMATQIQTVAAAARSSSKWNRQRPRVWSGTRIASGASSVASSSTWTITRATRARFTVSHTSRNSSNRNRLKSPTSLVSRSHRAVSRATRDLLESMPV